jgi:hypothetical protein
MNKWLALNQQQQTGLKKCLLNRYSLRQIPQIAQKLNNNYAEQPNSLLALWTHGKMKNVSGGAAAQHYIEFTMLQVTSDRQRNERGYGHEWERAVYSSCGLAIGPALNAFLLNRSRRQAAALERKGLPTFQEDRRAKKQIRSQRNEQKQKEKGVYARGGYETGEDNENEEDDAQPKKKKKQRATPKCSACNTLGCNKRRCDSTQLYEKDILAKWDKERSQSDMSFNELWELSMPDCREQPPAGPQTAVRGTQRVTRAPKQAQQSAAGGAVQLTVVTQKRKRKKQQPKKSKQQQPMKSKQQQQQQQQQQHGAAEAAGGQHAGGAARAAGGGAARGTAAAGGAGGTRAKGGGLPWRWGAV